MVSLPASTSLTASRSPANMKQPKLKEAIIEAARQGMARSEIVKTVGCSGDYVNTIVCHATKAGVLTPKPKVSELLIPEVVRLSAQGMSQRAIAVELHTYRECVRQAIRHARKSGLMPPPQPKAKKPAPAPTSLYSPHLCQEIRDLYYLHKMSLSKIAALFVIPEAETRKIIQLAKSYNRQSDIRLVPDRPPKPTVEVTDELRAYVRELRGKHYNATAISQQTGIEIGDVMDIIREDQLQNVVLRS